MTRSSFVAATLLVCGWLVTTQVPGRRRLAALMSDAPRKPRLGKGILGISAGVAMLVTVGRTATVVAVAVSVAVAWAVNRARSRQAVVATQVAVVELLRAVAGELRSGRPPSVAFAVAVESADQRFAPLIGQLARVANRGDAGELAAALRATASSGKGLAGLSRFAACWQVAVTSGASLAPAVDRVADALHDELELARSLAVSLAGPRTTVRLLAVLPLVGLGLGGVLGARPLAFLLGTPAGLGCLVAAVGFDLAGVIWGRRIANRAAVSGA